MQPIQTPSSPTSATGGWTPEPGPPLPQPGQAPGREELPRAGGGAETARGCTGGRRAGSPLHTYLVFMLFFTAIWAVSGGGHFWPLYPALGWGLGLALSGGGPRPPRGPSR